MKIDVIGTSMQIWVYNVHRLILALDAGFERIKIGCNVAT